MLIDSGADVTLLPKVVVESLGIPRSGARYELVAFDSTTSSADAVRAELVFLDKRFRGQFLLIEAEIGVLGRDVLDNVRVVLDGPGLQWEELRPPAKLS